MFFILLTVIFYTLKFWSFLRHLDFHRVAGRTFPGRVASGHGQNHHGTSGGFCERKADLTVGHNFIRHLFAVRLGYGAETVAVGAAGVVPIGNHGLAAGGTGHGGQVGGNFGGAGIAGFVKTEGIPAVVIVGNELVQLIAQTGKAGTSGSDAILIVLVGGAGIGVSLVAGGFGVTDGLGGGFAGDGGAGGALHGAFARGIGDVG